MNFLTKRELNSARDVKVEAKEQLRGHWKTVLILSLIPTLFTAFFMNDVNQSDGADLMWILLRIIQSFLTTGVSFTLLDFIRTREPMDPLRGSLRAFQGKYFANLLGLKILKNVYIFLWMLLFIIPGFVKSYGYTQAERIFKDIVDETGNPESIRLLERKSGTNVWTEVGLIYLRPQLFGWYLLSIMSLGIGLLWLVPYVEMSQTVFYQNSLGEAAPIGKPSDTDSTNPEPIVEDFEEVGKDPNDFRDFDDF